LAELCLLTTDGFLAHLEKTIGPALQRKWPALRNTSEASFTVANAKSQRGREIIVEYDVS